MKRIDTWRMRSSAFLLARNASVATEAGATMLTVTPEVAVSLARCLR